MTVTIPRVWPQPRMLLLVTTAHLAPRWLQCLQKALAGHVRDTHLHFSHTRAHTHVSPMHIRLTCAHVHRLTRRGTCAYPDAHSHAQCIHAQTHACICLHIPTYTHKVYTLTSSHTCIQEHTTLSQAHTQSRLSTNAHGHIHVYAHTGARVRPPPDPSVGFQRPWSVGSPAPDQLPCMVWNHRSHPQ